MPLSLSAALTCSPKQIIGVKLLPFKGFMFGVPVKEEQHGLTPVHWLFHNCSPETLSLS